MNNRPNILLIMADNHPASLLGCYENDEIHTPHIDQLAAEGTQFNQAYCVNAMCSPCRASVLTGLMPSQHGIHTWIDDRHMETWPPNWNALAEIETLPETLQKSGYQTALIGKYHLGDPSQSQNGFDHWVTFPHGHTRNFWGNTVIENGERSVYDGHIVDYFTEKAVDYLGTKAREPDKPEESEEPFFLFLPYNGPYGHWPSIQGEPRNRFASHYADCPMHSIPREGLSWPAVEKYLLRQHKSGGGLDYSAALRIPNDMPSLRNYFSQMSIVDDGVGQVLAALDANGLADDTLVIYTTDHGFSLGQHGFWGHGQATWPANTHAAAFHIPLIVRQPKDKRDAAPSSTDALVSQIDLFPTLIESAALPTEPSKPTSDNQAASLHPILDSTRRLTRQAIFMDQEETRAIRTERWLYMQRFDKNPKHPIQNALFDLQADPGERKSLVGISEFSETEATLQTLLLEHFQQTANPKYDLWNGGTAKSNSDKPWFWQEVWGDEWTSVMD